MAEFIQVPPFKPIPDAWRLYDDLIYRSDVLGRDILVPRGFESDLASVPEIVPDAIVDVANGPSRLPAVVHDYLCYTPVQRRFGIKQRHADKVFREALKVEGVNWISRNAVLWLPTRVFQFFVSPFKKTGEPPIYKGLDYV